VAAPSGRLSPLLRTAFPGSDTLRWDSSGSFLRCVCRPSGQGCWRRVAVIQRRVPASAREPPGSFRWWYSLTRRWAVAYSCC